MHQSMDFDPQQTREWLESLAAIVQVDGKERARYILAQLLAEARRQRHGPKRGRE